MGSQSEMGSKTKMATATSTRNVSHMGDQAVNK